MGRDQPVTGAPDSRDLRPCPGQLGPQSGHLDVDRVGPECVGLVLPGVLRDDLTVDDRRRSQHQDLEDPEFSPGEVQGEVRGRDLASRRIQRQRPASERPAIGAAGPALKRANSGKELLEVERLDEVVVRACVEPRDPVGRRVQRREHENRGPVTGAPDPLDDLEAG